MSEEYIRNLVDIRDVEKALNRLYGNSTISVEISRTLRGLPIVQTIPMKSVRYFSKLESELLDGSGADEVERYVKRDAVQGIAEKILPYVAFSHSMDPETNTIVYETCFTLVEPPREVKD